MRKNRPDSLFRALLALLALMLCVPLSAQVSDFVVSSDVMVLPTPTEGGLDRFTHNNALSVMPNGEIVLTHNTQEQTRQQFWYTMLTPEDEVQRLQLGFSQALDVMSPALSMAPDDFSLVTLPTANGADLRTLGVAYQAGRMFPSSGANGELEIVTDSRRLNLPQSGCEIVDLAVPERLPANVDAQTGRSRGTLANVVECADTRLYSERVRGGAGSPTLEGRGGGALTPAQPNAPGLKGSNMPLPIVDSGMAVGARMDGLSTVIYSARALVFPGDFPIIIEYAADNSISRIRELIDLEVATGASASYSLCGHQDLPHYWVSFLDKDDRVIVVQVDGEDLRYRTFGRGVGPIDMACDPWGNVFIGWQSINNSGSEIKVAAINQFGTLVNSLTTDLEENADGVILNVGVNADGAAALAWTDSSGTLYLRRYQLIGSARIDGSFMGSFFNPYFNGEGFVLDVARVSGVESVVFYYFTYANDGSGGQAWVVGSGPFEGNTFTAEVATGEGATFGDDFDTGDVTFTIWGTVHVRFLGCGLVRIEMDPIEYPAFGYLVQPLTDIPEGGSGRCAGGLEPPEPGRGGTGPISMIDATFAGSWFDPGRNGEGLVYDIVQSPGGPIMVLYYFTYVPDGSGRQAWLVGAAPISDLRALVPVAYGQGASFGPDFDPADVNLIPWGNVMVDFQNCALALVEYDGDWGRGEYFTLPLTAPPLGFNGECRPEVKALPESRNQ